MPISSATVAADTDFREISDGELAEVTGGMKWDRNHRSPNVVDMRGGQRRIGFFTVASYDINGRLSGVDYINPYL